jgi:hypothetical protein
MRTKFGYRTLEAADLVHCWPGASHNDIANRVGRWRQTGQDAVHRALYYGLTENRGTATRFALHVTDKRLAALDNAWPLFSPDAASECPDVATDRPAGVLGAGPPVTRSHHSKETRWPSFTAGTDACTTQTAPTWMTGGYGCAFLRSGRWTSRAKTWTNTTTHCH